MIGSASFSPTETTAALASTPRLTKPSTRARFVLGFDEAELDLLGFMVGLVQTEHRAVWGAEVAHTSKLAESSREAGAGARAAD